MTDLAAIYLVPPDIPVGMTIAAFRRSRPRRAARWRRFLRGLA